MVMAKTTGLFLLLAPLLGSGCAFHTHLVELSYPPLESHQAGLVETSFEPGQPIVIAAFEDFRRDQDLIGERRNHWKMHTAEVRAKAPVADWMRAAVAIELEREGFVVVTDPTEAGTPPLVLDGEVQRVGSSRRARTDAAVTLDVRVRRGFKLLWTRRYNGVVSLAQDELQGLGTNGVDPWGEALARALAYALAPLPGDLRTALERERAVRGESS